MKIVYLVGSLSSESLNRGLARALASLTPEDVEFVEAPIANLPLYNRDLDGQFPQEALDLKAAIEGADGIILLTPEHNRMYSAALANAIEWSSRPWGSLSLARKPVATIGVSVSALGTAAAQQHLRAMLTFFNAKIMGQPEGYIDALKSGLTPDGQVNDEARAFLEQWLAAFITFVRNSQ